MLQNTLLNTQMKGIKIAFSTHPVSRSFDFRFCWYWETSGKVVYV